MNRYFLLFLISVIVSVNTQASAKASVDSNAVNIARFKKWFNDNKPDSIYAIMDETFAKQMPLPDFIAFLKEVKGGSGKIIAAKFMSFRQRISTYHVIGEKDTTGFYLMMSTGAKGQISYLLFTKDAPASQEFASVDRVLDSLTKKYINRVNTVGLSVGIIDHGKITTHHYGETVKGLKITPDDNTIYELGSLTKTFSAVLIAWYVNEHKLKLSDPITKYLPEEAAKNANLSGITIEMLLNHSSGLPRMPDNFDQYTVDTLNPYKAYNRAHLIAYLANCRTESDPGNKFSYSNLGFAVLGLILEKVSGMQYEPLVKQVITGPLAMKSTVQHLSTDQKKKYVQVYNDGGDATHSWEFDAFASAGCLRGSLHDMLVFAGANLKNGTGKLDKAIKATQKINMVPEPNALGWFAARGGEPGKEANIFWHNGGTGGSHSFIVFSPAKNIAVVVLSNAAEDADFVGSGIFNAMLFR